MAKPPNNDKCPPNYQRTVVRGQVAQHTNTNDVAQRINDLHINDNEYGKTNFSSNDTHFPNPYQSACETSPDEKIQQYDDEIKRLQNQKEQIVTQAQSNRQFKIYSPTHHPMSPPPTMIKPHIPTPHSTIFDPSMSENSDTTISISSYTNTTPTPKLTDSLSSFNMYRDSHNTSEMSQTTNTSTINNLDCTTIPKTHPDTSQQPNPAYLYQNPNSNTHTRNHGAPILRQPTIYENLPQHLPQIPLVHNDQTMLRPNPRTIFLPYNPPRPTPMQRQTPPKPLSQPSIQFNPIHRSPRQGNLELINDIHAIASNDLFVENLGTNLTNQYPSDTDSETYQENHFPQNNYDNRHQNSTTPPCIPPLPTTPPKEKPANTAKIQPPTQLPRSAHLMPKPMPTLTPQSRPTTPSQKSYTILYDDSSLSCEGIGWKTDFVNYTNERIFDRIRANLDGPGINKLTTNSPFSDLYTQIQTSTQKQPMPKPKLNITSTPTSSNTSIQNLLTSTIDETNTPRTAAPNASPIPTTYHQEDQLNHSYQMQPNDINQSFTHHHSIDHKLRTSFNNTKPKDNVAESHSLPIPEYGDYSLNHSIAQTDGNDTDLDEDPSTPQFPTNVPDTPTVNDDSAQTDVLNKLHLLRLNGSSNVFKDTSIILQEAKMHHDPHKPETPFQRTIRKQISKIIQLERQQNTPRTMPPNPHATMFTPKTQPQSTPNPPTETLTDSESTLQIEIQNATIQELTFDSPDLNDEQVAHLIQQNKDIICNVSIQTEDEQINEEITQVAAEIQHITQDLTNLTSAIHSTYTERPSTPASPPPSTQTTGPQNHYLIHPYINNFNNIYTHQQDAPYTSCVSMVDLNGLQSGEMQEMQARTPYRCKDRFENTKDLYESVTMQIKTVILPTLSMDHTDRNPQIRAQLKQTKKHLYELRIKQLGLEKKLRTISTTNTNNNKGITIPTFGTQKRDSRQWKGIPVFNPKNETTLDIIWNVIAARGQRAHLDEDSYKEILEEILKGDALKYYTKNQNKPLRTILEILFNVYVTTPSRLQLRILLDNFQVHKNDNIKQTIEKLKLLTTEYFKDLTPERAQREEEIEIRRRIIENKLVDNGTLVTLYRKEKELRLEGRHFDFIRELIDEEDIQTEAGNNKPTIQTPVNTLALYNTTTTDQLTNPAEGQRLIGKPNQPHLSARPRRPSQETLDRLMRHSPARNRPRNNTPQSSPNRQQSPSPIRSQSPRHISESTHRDTENRQRTSRQSEFDKRRFDQKQFHNDIERDAQQAFKHQSEQRKPFQPRQTSHDPTQANNPRYQQYTNNKYPQNSRPRGSSVTPQTRQRSPQPNNFGTNKQYSQDQNNRNNNFENKPNYRDIGNKPNFNRNNYNSNNIPQQNNYNQSSYQQNRRNNYQSQAHLTQNPPSYNNRNNRTTNNNTGFNTNYKPRDQYDNYRPNNKILSHRMTYTGGNNRDGKVQQEFSFSELCIKYACRNSPDHSYRSCQVNKDFRTRH